MLATLEALPEDEIFTRDDIRNRAKINAGTLHSVAGKARFEKFRQRLGRRVLWGHPVAITELRRRLRGDN